MLLLSCSGISDAAPTRVTPPVDHTSRTIVTAQVFALNSTIQPPAPTNSPLPTRSQIPTVASHITKISPVQKTPYGEPSSIIREYYSLLEYGSYEQAYNLLSPLMQHNKNFVDYLEGAKSAFKTVQIKSIQPYSVWAKEQGYKNPETSSLDHRFVVTLIAVGNSPMSGSVPSGQLQTLFISVLGVDGVWKINSINTAP